MIGFREFIEEGWSRPDKKIDTWGKDYWHHKDNIAGHKVGIHFAPSAQLRHRGHTVSYDVDSLHNKNKNVRPPSPVAAHQIMKHVLGKIHQFTKRRKTDHLAFHSTLPVKKQLHVKLAKHLAATHGGESGLVDAEYNDETSIVRFKHGKNDRKK